MTKINKKYYLNIAKQLCYPEEVLIAINKAKSEEEISRIMADARHNGQTFKRPKK